MSRLALNAETITRIQIALTVFILSVLSTLGISGCRPATGESPQEKKTQLPQTKAEEPTDKVCNIRLHFFYRSTNQKAMGDSKSTKVKVSLTKGDVAEIDSGISKTVEFEELKCVIKTEPNSLTIKVVADTGKTIANQRYQFSEILTNQLDDHGFTGLHYFYHPKTEAELQAWAVVE